MIAKAIDFLFGFLWFVCGFAMALLVVALSGGNKSNDQDDAPLNR